MLPPLKIVEVGLQRTTEALAKDLASPGAPTPDWSGLEWQLAMAAAAAHGVAPLLHATSGWQNAAWQSFLAEQREHVAQRHTRIVALLEGIDRDARNAALPIVPLKGCALHALGIYSPGERPMADVDLLVRECDVAAASAVLHGLGYTQSVSTWKHRVFKPLAGHAVAGLGEHRDNQITVELHTRVQERLPVSAVDITSRIYPRSPRPGLNPYPTIGALMSHLLLHSAGNICDRDVRLLKLHDIYLLASRMSAQDWNAMWDDRNTDVSWWALPPLRLTQRYYRDAIPKTVLKRFESDCPAMLRLLSRGRTLTQVSSSALWIPSLPGMEWARSVREAGRYLRYRVRPSQEAVRERIALVPTQPWLQGHSWSRLSRGRQILVRLTRPVPRLDALYVVRAALARHPGG